VELQVLVRQQTNHRTDGEPPGAIHHLGGDLVIVYGAEPMSVK